MRQFKRCDRIPDTLDKRGFDPFRCFYVVQINHSFLTDAKTQDQPREIKKMEVVLVIVNATEYIEKKTTQEPRKKEIVMEDCMRCCKQTMIYLYCIDV